MMKKIFYLVIVIGLLISCSKEPHYVITGNIAGADSVTFLLQKRSSGKTVILDSAVAYKGSFKIKGGSVNYPLMVTLVTKGTRMGISFFLENANIEISGKLDSLYDARVTGSKTQDDYNGLMASSNALDDKYSKVYDEYQVARQEGDTSRASQLKKDAENIEKEMTDVQKAFVKNNPTSYASPYVLSGLSYDMEGMELESYINALDTSVARTETIMNLKERVVRLKAVAVGLKAPDFTMNDPEGNPVSLYSKIGPKLLLIDFWASWCGPCRRENPNVVKAYKEFNKKGFDIFGVSLDRKKDDWVKAISDDKLTWTHVSDLQYWSNAAARMYAVNAIPANFLLDEQGVIIGKNLRGDELYNKLKEVLGNK